VEEDAPTETADEKTKPNAPQDEAEPEDVNCDDDEMANDEIRISNEFRMTNDEEPAPS
jgi:hypothetical protein